MDIGVVLLIVFLAIAVCMGILHAVAEARQASSAFTLWGLFGPFGLVVGLLIMLLVTPSPWEDR